MTRAHGVPLALGALALIACRPSATEPPAEGSPTETPEATPGSAAGAKGAAHSASYDGVDNGHDDPNVWGPDKTPLTVTVRNDCSSTVFLFFGQQPQPGSNYYTTMNGRSQSAESLMVGDKVWILDEDQNGIAHTVVELETSEVVVESSCDAITTR